MLQEFDRLADQVDRLVARCEALSQENGGLRERIGALEARLEEKTDAEGRLLAERKEVRSRIDGLLVRLRQAGSAGGDQA
ncbi:MAG: cell division protein ZapB [Deltaproteobacteria bacterium]|nr:cell division protein ZapB [Deltaproteobacteria bacterium]